ncbi:MAG: hypothetical protein ACLT98_14470 [Eggerthellaceae bacterium]
MGIRIGDEAEKSAHTTPESPDLQQLLARMRDARCDVGHGGELSCARPRSHVGRRIRRYGPT